MGTRQSTPHESNASSSFEQLVGTEVEGVLKVSEAALNELLHIEGSPLRGARLTVTAGNQVVVRYGVLHARAGEPQIVWVGSSPRLILSLTSLIVALALKAALRQPYVEVHGRRLVIHLQDVPALSGWRNLWSHFRRLEVALDGAGVRLQFGLTITE